MFRCVKLVLFALAIVAFAETRLAAQRTPRQRGWSYAGDPRAERTPNFRLPMEALLSAKSPEDLIRASLEPPQVRRVIAKPQTPPPPAPAATVESVPDEEVDPFADDPVAETTPAVEAAVVATEPAAPAAEKAGGPADDGLTGSQLLGVLGDVAGSFLPDTSRVTEALPPIPGVAAPPGMAPPGAGPPEMSMPPAASDAPSDPFGEPADGATEGAIDGADPFSAPPDAADPFADAPPVDGAAPAEADPFSDGAAEPAAETPELDADPFQ